MTSIEFIEKQVARLESLIEVAKKCCDESLVREAEKKIEKNKQVIADLKKLEMLEKENLKLREIISLLKLRLHVVGVNNEEDFYYIDTEYRTRYAINKTEYDLLKEVLENGVD